jgi:Phage major capsid protein E
MQPTPGDVHVNTPLTQISIAYLQNANNFVSTAVFPNIPVQKQADRYYTYDRGQFNRDEMRLRAPGTETSGGGYSVDNTPTYFANVYGFHHDIPDEVRSNADDVLNPDREATAYVTHKALIKREKLWVANYFATGKWTTDITGVSGTPSGAQVKQWNDSTSTPTKDIRAGAALIAGSTGFEPNTLVIGRQVFEQLLIHPEILDRIKYGQTPGSPAMANQETLAKVFGLDRVLVSNAIENTAKEGQTAAHVFIAGKSALLCHSATNPGLMTPSAGYTFSWTGFTGAGAEGNRIRQFRMEPLKSDRVEIDMAFDLKLVAADLGYYWTSVVA